MSTVNSIPSYESKTNSLPFWTYPVVGAATGAAVGGARLLSANSKLNNAKKVVSADEFKMSNVKKVLTNQVKNTDIYQLDNVKGVTLEFKKGQSITKDAILTSINEAKNSLKQNSAKYIGKFAGIAVAMGLLTGLIDKATDNHM